MRLISIFLLLFAFNASADIYEDIFQLERSGSLRCCKYCVNSQACGDSCISKSYTCKKPSGCACNGSGDNGGGGNNNDGGSNKAPKKNAGSVSLSSNSIHSSPEDYTVLCGYMIMNQQWLPIKALKNGKYITLKRLIKNLKAIAEFKKLNGDDKIYKTIKKLRKKNKKDLLICALLPKPF